VRVLVCGDRNWTARGPIWDALFELYYAPNSLPFVVIEGRARGADTIAGDWADQAGKIHGVEHLRFPANWNLYGKAAGFIRNQRMLTEGNPDLVLAFHANLEHSKGTKDMVARARKVGVAVRVVTK
jgi:hypothetical protein